MPDLTSPSPLAMVVRPGALAESRDRWRELALLGSALVFETDERQRLVLVEPASAFGWNTADLLGRPLAVLLDPVDGGSPGGIGDCGGRTEALPRDRPLRGRLGWVRRPDGGRAAVRLCTAPVRNGGLRGTVQDVDGAERERRGLAEALSRRQTVREIARRMRRPVLP
ncbi:MAG: hypothetical protein INR65_20235, partial [Gluconacetobacter diazotrophicus]|nr:hypothetical protein [Gluconacetobacter diazotrophicus]